VTADQSPVTGSSDTAVSVALTGLASNTSSVRPAPEPRTEKIRPSPRSFSSRYRC
jgi:hypothetical protein